MSRQREELWGHPKGLFICFLTELWERFSFYGMRAILVLYMVAKLDEANPGMGWTKGFALSIYGWYTMAVYVASLPGGIIADRWLGQKKTVMIGGLLLCVGHCILAINSVTAFAVGLILITLGVGGLKSNISTMVGGLYPAGDIRRDSAFTIFYMGINLGALVSSVLVGYVGETIGWHYGFGLAGIGMLIGQAVFFLGRKHLEGVGDFVPPKIEKDRVVVLLLVFLLQIVFWAGFEQGGGLMNLYTSEKVDRMIMGFEIPASIFQAANPLFIILLGTLVANYWLNRRKQRKQASSIYKMAIGTMVMGAGFLLMDGAAMQAASSGKAAAGWIIGAYLLHTIGELCASPVVMSFTTKLAPAKYASLMMGCYFAVTGLGNKLAGMAGELSEHVGEMSIFTGLFGFCTVFGLLLLALLKKLTALSHGADEDLVV
jgi:POT family proton-dependent oligopeptide transporter